MDKPGEEWRRHIVSGLKVLADFAQYGRIGRARADIEEIHLYPATKKVLRDYEQYGKDRLQLRPATLQKRTTELTIFLDFLNSRKARTLDQIQALDLSEFLSSRGHLKPNTVSRIVSDMRSFLRFLTMRGILQKDLSAELPTIRVPEMPVSPRSGITNSSSSSRGDRSQFGQRQARLRHSLTGMPIGIACRGHSHTKTRSASLGGFNDRNHAIENGHAVQATSDRRSRRSLIDYLKSGRPQTAHREIFLKVNPPFDPFTGKTTCTTLSRIGACWQGSNFGLRKNVACIPYATLWRLGFWRRERPLQQLPRF